MNLDFGRERNFRIIARPKTLKDFFEGVGEAPVGDLLPAVGRLGFGGTVEISDRRTTTVMNVDVLHPGANPGEEVLVFHLGRGMRED